MATVDAAEEYLFWPLAALGEVGGAGVENVTSNILIRFDRYGHHEPEIMLPGSGNSGGQQFILLAEAEQKGIVSAQSAEHVRRSNQVLREVAQRLPPSRP